MRADDERLRRAAVLVSALDRATADALLDRLSEEQARLVRRAVVELDEVDAGERQAIVRSFLDGSNLGRVDDAGVGLELSPAALQSVSPETPFQFLHAAAEDELRDLLAGEHPQTVAVVLAHLPSDRVARVLAELPAALQADVVRRLAALEEADAETLRSIDESLRSRFRRRVTDDRRTAGVGGVKGLLSEATPQVRRTLLSNIARQDLRLAERLSGPTFGFIDLAGLSDDSLRDLLAAVDDDYVATALAGSDLESVRRFMATLPRRRAERLQRGIDNLGPTRLSDVELAQRELVETARRMHASGLLEWSEPSRNAN